MYGYKIHVVVDVQAELPVSFSITKVGAHDSTHFQRLYSDIKSYKTWFTIRFYTADKAFDSVSHRILLLRDEVMPVIKASKTRVKPKYPQISERVYEESQC